MYPPNFLKSCPAFIRAPIAGIIHFGVIKLSINFGTKVVTGPFNIQSYLLMHTIGTAFSESMKKIGNWTKNTFRRSGQADSSFLKKFVLKLVVGFNHVTTLFDRVYCYVIGKIFFGEIHRSEDAAKLSPRELCMSEIWRKLFWEHIKEQFLYIGSWEIGRRGAEMLLKTTILTFMPATKVVYTAFFCLTYYKKVDDFRKNVYEEQKDEIGIIFTHPDKMINRQIKHLCNMMNEKVEKEKAVREARNLYAQIHPDFDPVSLGSLNIDRQVEIIESLSNEFKEVTHEFELRWKYYSSVEIDDLNVNADFYKSIYKRYLKERENPEDLVRFKVDLTSFFTK